MSEPILFEQRGQVALLTPNRPDARNALGGDAMFAAVEQLFDRMNSDMAVRAAVPYRRRQRLLLGRQRGRDAQPHGHVRGHAPQVLRWTKQALQQQSRTATLDEALDAAGRWQGLAHHTADHAEAVAAFFDKRAPRFARGGRLGRVKAASGAPVRR